MGSPESTSVPRRRLKRATIAAGILAIVVGAGGMVLIEDDFRDTHVSAPDGRETMTPLFAPRTVGQTFRATKNNMSAIGLPLAPYTQKNPEGRLVLHLREAPAAVTDLRVAFVPALVVRRDTEARFAFPPIPDSRGKTFFLLLEYPDGAAERAIGVRFQPPTTDPEQSDGSGERYLNGTATDGALAFSLYHRERPLLAVQFFAGIGVLGIAALVAELPGTKRCTRRRRVLLVLLVGIPLLLVLPFLRDLPFPGREHWDPLFIRSPASLHALAVALLGPILGTKVLAFLALFTSFWGMTFLLLNLGRTTLAALLGASIFTFTSFFSLHGAYAGIPALAYAGLPWIALAIRKLSTTRYSYALVSGALGVILLEGGAFIALVSSLFAILGYCKRSRVGAARMRVFLFFTLAILSVLTVQEARHQLPLATRNPAPTVTLAPLRAATDIFLDPRQDGFVEKFPQQSLPWVEIGAYVGVFPLLLSALGVLSRFRAMWRSALPGLVALPFVLMPGVQEWTLRTFTTVVAPADLQRLVMIVVASIAVSTALGFDAIREFLRADPSTHPRRTHALFVATAFLVAIIILDLARVSGQAAESAFDTATPSVARIHTGPIPSTALLGIAAGTLGISALWRRWTRGSVAGTLSPRNT